MFAFQILKSKRWWSIRYYQVNSIWLQCTINLFNHFAYWNQWIITTHKSINCRLIKYHIKDFILISHLSNIHDFIDHVIIFFLDFNFFHFFDTYFRNVIVDCVLISCFIEIILNFAISTSNVKYFSWFIIIELFFNNILRK